MPGYTEELWVGILADFSQMRKGLRGAKIEAQSFVGQIGAMSNQLRSFGKTTTIASGIVAGLGAVATKVFADFEQQMANTQSVLGATQKQFDMLSDHAREMGKTTIFTASQSAQAMYYLASAGYNVNQTMGALEGTLKLAAATQYDLAETTRIVVSTLNAYRMSAEDATKVSNIFSAVISASQATMDRLGDSLKYVSPVAANLDIPLQQIVATLGILYNSGLEASQAGTYLRQGLIRLQKPTRQAKEALKSMGLSIEDVNPQTKDLVEILRTLEKAEAGAKDKGDELAAIFGTRSLTAFQTLIRNGADQLESLQKRITGTNKAFSMAEIQINTLKGSFKLLLSALQEAGIQIGEILAPIVRSITDAFRDMVMVFNGLPSILKKILVLVPSLAAALGLIVGPIALLLSLMPKIIAAFGTLTTVLSGVGPIVIGAVVGITALIGVLGYLVSAERRAKEEQKKSLKTIEDHIGKRMDEANSIKALTAEYQSLLPKAKNNEEIQSRLNGIIDELNTLMPGLNLSTEDYAKNLVKVKKAAGESTVELEKLVRMKSTLERIKVTIEIGDLRKQVRELNEDLRDFEIGGKVKFENKEALKSLNTWKQISGEISHLGEVFGEYQVDTEKVTKELSKNVKNTEFQRNLMDDINNLTTMAADEELKIQEIRSKAIEQNRDLTQGEIFRINTINTQKKAYDSISGSYTELLGKSSELLNAEISLQEAEQKRKDLAKEKVKETGGKPPKPIATKTEDDFDSEKEKQALIYELERQTLQNIVDKRKQAADQSLQNAILAIEAEYDYKAKLVEQEKEMTVKRADELGLKEYDIAKTYNDKIANLESEKQGKISSVKQEYADKDAEMKMRQLEFESEQNQAGLDAYKEFLEEKLSMVEEWSDEYVQILREITSIERQEGDKRLESARYWADGIINMFDNMAQAWGRLGTKTKMTDIWKVGLKSVVDMIADYYKGILRMSALAELALSNFAAAAQSLAAIGAITGAQAYIKNRIDSAEIGAEVQKAGLLKVHPKETIVPADVTRKSKKVYEQRFMANAMDGMPTGTVRKNDSRPENKLHNMIESGERGKTVINLINPMVNDPVYWENVVEEYVEPSLVRMKKKI